LGVSVDDKLFVSASDDNTCRLVKLTGGECIRKLTFSEGLG